MNKDISIIPQAVSIYTVMLKSMFEILFTGNTDFMSTLYDTLSKTKLKSGDQLAELLTEVFAAIIEDEKNFLGLINVASNNLNEYLEYNKPSKTKLAQNPNIPQDQICMAKTGKGKDCTHKAKDVKGSEEDGNLMFVCGIHLNEAVPKKQAPAPIKRSSVLTTTTSSNKLNALKDEPRTGIVKTNTLEKSSELRSKLFPGRVIMKPVERRPLTTLIKKQVDEEEPEDEEPIDDDEEPTPRIQSSKSLTKTTSKLNPFTKPKPVVEKEEPIKMSGFIKRTPIKVEREAVLSSKTSKPVITRVNDDDEEDQEEPIVSKKVSLFKKPVVEPKENTIHIKSLKPSRQEAKPYPQDKKLTQKLKEEAERQEEEEEPQDDTINDEPQVEGDEEEDASSSFSNLSINKPIHQEDEEDEEEKDNVQDEEEKDEVQDTINFALGRISEQN
jgi:hypothetical protein